MPVRKNPYNTNSLHNKAEGRLRAHFAANLGSIEPGLRLFNPDSEEFTCRVPGLGRVGGIDILAIDSLQRLVVIEVKSEAAGPTALGQLIGYVAWVRKHLQHPTRSVRAMIIAPSATTLLTLALETFDLFPVAFHRVDKSTLSIATGAPKSHG